MKFQMRLFIYMVVGFILATVIGTITHELGHYLTATYLGYESQISYASTWSTATDANDSVNDFDSFLITLGGPLQTMITGTIGLVFLFLIRKSIKNSIRLSFRQWALIFISLFWLRQTANFLILIVAKVLGKEIYNYGDEGRLATYLELPTMSIITITGAIGAIVCTVVIFKFVPVHNRLTFIASGITGGVAGFILWMYLIGPILMPMT